MKPVATGRWLGAAMTVWLLAVSAEASAQPLPPPAAPADDPFPDATETGRALRTAHCGRSVVTIRDPSLPGHRIGFAAEPGEPARLILCPDRSALAYPVPIDSIDTALVFMAYRRFAPFWPVAEARWGHDLGRLREEVRATPITRSLAAYPYARQMERRFARAVAASRTADSAGDHVKARALIEAEIAYIAALEARRPRNGRYDFELSLLLGRVVNLHARKAGPSAAADLMRDLLVVHPLDEEYRANTDINHAALLAEAGRADEALAIMEPLFAEALPDPADPERYLIPGSLREFSWIMACALHRKGDPESAEPFIETVGSYRQQPIDPYVRWTKSNIAIQLRMYKCMGDEEGFIGALQRDPPSILSSLWIEFQQQGRTVVGHYRFAAQTDPQRTKMLAADYRQLPESYWPALGAWAGETSAPTGE